MTINEQVIRQYKRLGAEFPFPVKLGEFGEREAEINLMGIEAYVRVKLGTDNKRIRQITDAAFSIAEKLEPLQRDDFLSFARTDNFLGRILRFKDPLAVMRTIDSRTGNVEQSNRFDFLYSLAPTALETCENEPQLFAQNIDAVLKVSKLMSAQSRKWMFTREDWSTAQEPMVVRGLGCQTIILHGKNPKDVEAALTQCVREAEGLNSRGERKYKGVSEDSKMDYYMMSAVDAIRVYGQKFSKLGAALRSVVKSGETLDDTDARCSFYQYTAPQAIKTLGNDIQMMSMRLGSLCALSHDVGEFARGEFFFGAAPSLIRTFGRREGMEDAVHAITETRTSLKDNILESLFYRDVVPSMQPLGYSRERIRTACSFSKEAIDKCRAENHSEGEVMKMTSQVIPKLLIAISSNYELTSRAQIISGMQDLIDLVEPGQLMNFMESAAPTAVEAINPNEAQRGHTGGMFYPDSREKAADMLFGWCSKLVEVGASLEPSQRDKYYTDEMPEMFRIVSGFDVEKMGKYFGNNNSLLYRNLRTVMQVGAPLEIDKRIDAYHYLAPAAFKVAKEDPESVRQMMEAGLSSMPSLPSQFRRAFRQVTLANIILCSRANPTFVAAAGKTTCDAVQIVSEGAKNVFMRSLIPAVALSSEGDATWFSEIVDSTVEIVEDPQGRIAASAGDKFHSISHRGKTNIYGNTVPIILQRFTDIADFRTAVEKFVSAYVTLTSSERTVLALEKIDGIAKQSRDIADYCERLDRIMTYEKIEGGEEFIRSTVGREVYDVLVAKAAERDLQKSDINISSRQTATNRGRIWNIVLGDQKEPVQSYILKKASPGNEQDDMETYAKAAAHIRPLVPRLIYAGTSTREDGTSDSFLLVDEVDIEGLEIGRQTGGRGSFTDEQIVEALATSIHDMNMLGIAPRERKHHMHPLVTADPQGKPRIQFTDVERICDIDGNIERQTRAALVKSAYSTMQRSFDVSPDRLMRLTTLFDRTLSGLGAEADSETTPQDREGSIARKYHQAQYSAVDTLLRSLEQDTWSAVFPQRRNSSRSDKT